ncbi:MAG: RDD family protein [Acidimicrobiales bacterium]
MPGAALHHSTTRGPTVGDARPARALHHSSVVTPEAVLLEFRAAGLGSRILAKAIDAFLQLMLFTFVLAPVGAFASGAPVVATVLTGVLGFLFIFGYPVTEAFMSGQTLGKKIMGIRVVTTEGGPVQFRHAAVRSLIALIEFVLPPGGAMAMIAALTSRRSQRIGDMAAGTIVVRLERSMPQPVFFPVVRGHEHFCEQFDAGGMTKDQFAVLRDYMLRYRHLSADAARHLAQVMADGLQRSGATPRPQHMAFEHYLMAAVFAYQRRFSFADGSTQAPVLPAFTSAYGVGFTTAAPPPPIYGPFANVPMVGSYQRPPAAPPPAPPSGPPMSMPPPVPPASSMPPPPPRS